MTTTTTKRPAKKATAKQPAPRKRAEPKVTQTKGRLSTAVKPPSVVEPTPLAGATAATISAMTRTEAYNVAKIESAAVKAWEAAGATGDRPATPALDFLNDPTRKAKKASAERASAKYGEIGTTLIGIVQTARATGVSFPKLAEKLNAETYAGRSDWTGPKLYAFACRNEVGKLPLVKGAK